MRTLLRILVIAAFCSAAFWSCRRASADIIPRGTMSKIYAELFLLDQQLMQQDNTLQRIADTTRVYEPVFEKYGYTYEDFIASESRYLDDPKRFVRMIKKATGILTRELKGLKNEQKIAEALLDASKGVARFFPRRIYLLDTIKDAGALLNFDFRKGLDTVYEGPRMIVWADSLQMRDTLAPADSVPRRDTVVRAEPAAERKPGSEEFHPRTSPALRGDAADDDGRTDESVIPSKIDQDVKVSDRKRKFDKFKEMRNAKDQ